MCPLCDNTFKSVITVSLSHHSGMVHLEQTFTSLLMFSYTVFIGIWQITWYNSIPGTKINNKVFFPGCTVEG